MYTCSTLLSKLLYMKKASLLSLFLCFSLFLLAQDCQQLIHKGVDDYENQQHNHSLEALLQAQEMAQEKDDNACLYLALLNIGNNYFSLLDYGVALEFYLKAHKIASLNLDQRQEMQVLNNIAIVYSKDGNMKKAEEFFLKAYELSLESDDVYKKGLYANNLGEFNNKEQQWEKATTYFKMAFEYWKDAPSTLSAAKIGYTRCLIGLENYDEALAILQSLVNEQDTLVPLKSKHLVYFLWAQIYQQQGKLERAITYNQKALAYNQALDAKIDILNQLATLYQATNQLDKALIQKDSAMSLLYQFHHAKNSTLAEANKIKFELQDYQLNMKRQALQFSNQRKILYSLIVGAVLLILFLYWVLKNNQTQSQQRQIILERNRKITELELQKKEQENRLLEQQLKEKEAFALMEQAQLKNEIDQRNRELSAKAIYLANKNDLLSKIIKNLEQNTKLKDPALIKTQVKELKQLLKNEDEWNRFIIHFESVNQGFIANLKKLHPTLNANDIRFISYIYMNLSSKEIASVFNITPQAFRKRKERISKKLNIDSSSLLYNYLAQLA